MGIGNPLDNPVFAFAKRLKNLSAEEERTLIKRTQAGDDAARAKLIAHNVRFVAKAAIGKKSKLSSDDLMQEGLAGLSHAIDKFDLSQPWRLGTYATWTIRQRLQQADFDMRSVVRPPAQYRHMGMLKFRLKEERERLIDGGVTEPTLTRELCAKFDVSEAVVDTCFMLLSGGDKSMNAPVGEDDGSAEFGDLLADDRPLQDEMIEAAIDGDSRGTLLSDALNLLPAREQEVVRRRFYTEDSETLEQIADSFGITRERVRQIEVKALARLRKILGRRT